MDISEDILGDKRETIQEHKHCQMKLQYIEKLLPDIYSSSCICITHYHDNAQAQKERWKERKKERWK
jgi:hypothetical protein